MDLKYPFSVTGDRLAAMAGGTSPDPLGIRTIATTDHAEITRWAVLHKAEPATDEATTSGPAVRHSSGPAIRFNFPGCGPLRPITWAEWFEHFDRHNLLFVYEHQDTEQIAHRAHARWQARGNGPGSDRDDWLQAERELQRTVGAGSPMGYHVIKNQPPR